MKQMYAEVSGDGADLLVLLHGMGTTGAIWSPFVAARPRQWLGRILVLDLPGHGASPPLEDYAVPRVAEEVSRAVDAHLPGTGRYRVLGHSYGGVVALALAGLAGTRRPDHVHGLGIKSVWSVSEVSGMHRLAARSPRLFSEPAEAGEWYCKVAGIADLDVGPECAERGVVEASPGQWRLAQDPRVHGMTPPDMQALTADLQGCFSLGYGSDDSMVDSADLARCDPSLRRLPGGGHNIMVSNPAAVWEWLVER
jgi:pimeloyl-ACP methyl ester carboxylesterase